MNIRHTVATAVLVGSLVATIGACGGTATTPPPSVGPVSSPTAASASGSSPAAAAGTTAETVRDFKFDIPDLALKAGTALVVTNAGPTVHNLKIRDAAGALLDGTDDLKPGAGQTITISVPAGRYTIICSLPGHESLGIKGTLTVSN